MRDTDVLVIGAGPAGAVAAWEAKRAAPELDVVLLERDRAVGAPVRCAEGVGDAGLREFATPEGAPWVARKITRVIFLAPDDTEETVRARVVIGADGVEAMVGRWAGLDTRVPARDMESCAQYVLQGIDVDPDAIYIQWGERVAPGGYAWVFPKGDGTANVGLGLVALRSDGRNARAYLDEWVARCYTGGASTGYTVGGVIVHTTVQKTYADGVLLAGDTAHMINPLSGGGIVNAMKAGRLAGGTASAAIREGDTSAHRLSSYHDTWMKLLGEDHLKYYRIKQALENLSDDFFNGLAHTVNQIPLEKRTLGRIFTHALVRHPQLIPVAARFFL